MKIHQPGFISSRLMAAVRFGEYTISIGYKEKRDTEGRTVYDIFVDKGDSCILHETTLKSGCQGGTLQEGLCSFSAYVSAFVEADKPEYENSRIFSKRFRKHAEQFDDAFTDLRLAIEEDGFVLFEE